MTTSITAIHIEIPARYQTSELKLDPMLASVQLVLGGEDFLGITTTVVSHCKAFPTKTYLSAQRDELESDYQLKH